MAGNCCEGNEEGFCEYECEPGGFGFLINGDCSTKFPPTPYPDPCDGEEDPPCENCFCEETSPPACPPGVGEGETFFTTCWVPDAGGGTLCSDL